VSQPPAATDCGVAVHVLLSAIHSTPRGRGRAPRVLVLHAHSPQRSNRSVTGADKRGAGERGHSCYHGRVPHGGADWGGFVWEGVQGAPALHVAGHSSLPKMVQTHACRFACAGGSGGGCQGSEAKETHMRTLRNVSPARWKPFSLGPSQECPLAPGRRQSCKHLLRSGSGGC